MTQTFFRMCTSSSPPDWRTPTEQRQLPLLAYLVADQRVRQEHRRHFGVASRDVRRETSHAGAAEGPTDWIDARVETPSKSMARVERKELVQAALDRLEPIDREILTLRDLEGLSNDECAERLGISKAGVSNRYRRAQARLRPLLENNPALLV